MNTGPPPRPAFQALVIPAALNQSVRVVEFAHRRELPGLIRREIGCTNVDLTPQIPTRFGPFALWLDDNGFYQQPVQHNHRAVALCRAFGYQVPDLARTAVLTAMDGGGNVVTLPPQLRNWLLDGFQRLQGTRAGAKPEQEHRNQRAPAPGRPPNGRVPRADRRAQPPDQDTGDRAGYQFPRAYRRRPGHGPTPG